MLYSFFCSLIKEKKGGGAMIRSSAIWNFIKAVNFVLQYGTDMVLRDSVTTLYTKGVFKELSLQLLKSIAHDHDEMPVSLIFADMDGLKKANDQFGHLNGNHLLYSSAIIFLNELRESDIIGRYGGDEFIVLLPSTDLSGAEVVVNKIRTALEKSAIKWSFGISTKKIPSRLSFKGLTRHQLITEREKFLNDLILEADNLMYLDKKSLR